jgi:L-glutamine-phosphate cytidylyltransferase
MTNAIILAAGEGTRLRPYTDDNPKCLVKINERSLLDRQLEVLESFSFNTISIVTGYLAEKIEREGIKKYLNDRFSETNMVYSLFCAENAMNDEIILSYGDIVYSREILKKLVESTHDISVVVDLDWEEYWRERCDDPLDDAETLKIDQEGKIIEIGQTPKDISDIEGQYIGLMKFSLKGIKILKNIYNSAKKTGFLDGKQYEKAYMTDLLQAVINDGHCVMPIFINGAWVEIDSVSDLKLNITEERIRDIEKSN